MRIALLHTIDGNRQIFDDAARHLGLPVGNLRHEVRSDLREAVQQAASAEAARAGRDGGRVRSSVDGAGSAPGQQG